MCQAPFLLDDPNVELMFPADAIERAKHYLAMTSGGLGTPFNLIFVEYFLGQIRLWIPEVYKHH